MTRTPCLDRTSTALAALARTACAALIVLAVAPALAQVRPAATTDVSKVGEEQRTKLNLYLSPRQAADFVAKNKTRVLFLDVRTRAEAVYTGMANPADALVPYVEFPEMHADWGWDENRGAYKYEPFNDFAPEVARRLKEKGLTKEDAIVLMCRSGDRSSRAANLLADLGYPRVYSVVGGFEGPPNEKTGMRDVAGWKKDKLPWSHKLDKSKMYFVR